MGLRFNDWKLLLLAFGLSFILTRGWLWFARRINWRDQNKDHQLKKTAVQRPATSGGIVIYAVFWLLFYWDRPNLMLTSYYQGLWQASTIIIITGLIDDRWNLSGLQKSIGIILASSVIYFKSGIVFQTALIPFEFVGLNYFLTVSWIYLMTNAINLIDGVDGLASNVVLISLTVMLIVARFFSLSIPIVLITILMLLIGALLGFMPYNWYPAQLYLGDTGALFLGFMAGVLSVTRLKNATFYSLVLPILMFMVPLFDTFYATLRRLMTGQSIVIADLDHLHHRLLRRGFSVQKVVMIMSGIALVFGILAILFQFLHPYRQYILLGILVGIAGLFIWMRQLNKT